MPQQSVAGADLPLLRRYARINGASYCRHACQDCLSACPYGVPIGDVLRARMYAVDYGDLALARSEHAMLPAGAAPCLSCAAQPCRAPAPTDCPATVSWPRRTGC
jgi:predicted aldo/keto reductase-like oxidoreductase